jgi:hypothetical protein
MGSLLEDFTGEFGKGIVHMVWEDRGLTDGINKGSKRTQDAVMLTLERYAPEIEGYMKVNAPWSDQTSNARNGLAARAFRESGSMGIVMFHQVPYGIYLETKYSGRYAIIGPTIEEYGPRVMGSLRGLMGEI